MIEIADVFRRFAGGYIAAHGGTMPPSHKRAITDIMPCRTESIGGHLWRCDHCSAEVYAEAVLRYLARYVFRTAITNNRLVSLDETGVAFRHKHRASNRWRITRLKADEFMRRFFQHVLPKGLHKVRYFGLWHPAKAARLPACGFFYNWSSEALPQQTRAYP